MVWGINENDCLGLSNKRVIDQPTRLPMFTQVVDFACGKGFALVIAANQSNTIHTNNHHVNNHNHHVNNHIKPFVIKSKSNPHASNATRQHFY